MEDKALKQIDVKLDRIINLMISGLVIQLYKEGLTYGDICEIMHISKTDVTKILSGYQKAKRIKNHDKNV